MEKNADHQCYYYLALRTHAERTRIILMIDYRTVMLDVSCDHNKPVHLAAHSDPVSSSMTNWLKLNDNWSRRCNVTFEPETNGHWLCLVTSLCESPAWKMKVSSRLCIQTDKSNAKLFLLLHVSIDTPGRRDNSGCDYGRESCNSCLPDAPATYW